MALNIILAFGLLALIGRWLVPPRWLGRFTLIVSLLAIYALQPSTPLRGLDFWLPTAAIGLTAWVWAVCRPVSPFPLSPEGEGGQGARGVFFAAALVLAPILLVALTRYSGVRILSMRPPALPVVTLGLGLFSGGAALLWRASWRRPRLAGALLSLVIGLLIVLKTPALALAASVGLRAVNEQPVHLAAPADLAWLGFSYLAFRLVHALREAQAGKLPAFSLDEFAAYALFFPAFTAGPIDKAPRWLSDLRQVQAAEPSAGRRAAALDDTLAGGQRILIGVFKKFVLADSLALLALSPQNAGQIRSTGWAWALLLAYSLRLYFDFAGYTDVAIGLGRILGFRLPENFDRPYTRPNLTAFWNSWHISLSLWFRAYFFNPFTRWLRSRPAKPPVWLVILAAQLSTMILIGVWHGVTWNFLIWGAWHGLGLFVHNRYADWARPRLDWLAARPRLARLAAVAGWLLTFLYVILGWVWFALPTPAAALAVFSRLFGLGGPLP